ncbi:hypothetical protein Goe21_01220 [Bacillus phage vB_BsuM-Goe21]|nr:hypothetical protein Goe21_01220 [Bacillus phage vB_BsuM-Goe21]
MKDLINELYSEKWSAENELSKQKVHVKNITNKLNRELIRKAASDIVKYSDEGKLDNWSVELIINDLLSKMRN